MRIVPLYGKSKDSASESYTFLDAPSPDQLPKFKQVLSGLEGFSKAVQYFFLSPWIADRTKVVQLHHINATETYKDLKAEDWYSDEVNWLFDVIAPSKALTSRVIRNLTQVIKQGDLHIHPLVAKLISVKDLETMGAKRQVDAQQDVADAPTQH